MNPESNRNQSITCIIVGLLILVGIFFVLRPRTAVAPTGTATTTATSTTYTINPSSPTTTIPGYTIKQIPIANPPTAPNYKAPPACASDVTPSECSILAGKVALAAAAIAKDKTDFRAWVQLGTLRKIAGDNVGAAAAWEYASVLYPANIVTFGNLGDLYMNFLHDYPKSEASYLKAIVNDPKNADLYRNLFGLYTTTSYKGAPGAAENIMKKGIAAVPGAIDLQVSLARYYKSLGRTTDARTTYDAAIANAKSQGNTALAAQIQSEAIQ